MGDTLSDDQWIERVLGVSYIRQQPEPPRKTVRAGPEPKLMPQPQPGHMIGQGRPRSGRTITPPNLVAQTTQAITVNGKQITIVKGKNGRPMFTAPPPPVQEITFSGGGAKGAALPGALKALQESHMLDNVKVIYGASVGAMTASLVAAGISAEDFTEISNSDDVTNELTDGTGGSKLSIAARIPKNLAALLLKKVTTLGESDITANPLTGEGIEGAMSRLLDISLNKRALAYNEECRTGNVTPDAMVTAILENMSVRKDGPTFGELKYLAGVIPGVKEVSITGTYTTEFEIGPTGGRGREIPGGNEKGKLYMFNAQTEPDLAVSVAVHASASFPIVFKPVNIKLSNGKIVRFIDGGTMNNTPTSSSVGTERNIDPVPEKRGMTFVFEGSGSESLQQGQVKTKQGLGVRFQDCLVNSENAASEYGKNRDISDRPEELVVVPLRVTIPGSERRSGKDREVDMRDGTLEFGLDVEAKIVLQKETEKATNAQIAREMRPKTREFASDTQMFVSIPIADLQALASSGYQGAAAAAVFRADVKAETDELLKGMKAAEGNMDTALADPTVIQALDHLTTLSGDNIDYQGYVARELNKGPLDELMRALKRRPGRGGILEAAVFVTGAIEVHEKALELLKDLVYPKMKMEKTSVEKSNGLPHTTGIETLQVMEGLLRAAKTPADFNDAVKIGIDHFAKKSDKMPPFRDHKKFARALGAYTPPE